MTDNNKQHQQHNEKETEVEFERIFWKVIHNKYLFKLIFHFIEIIGWERCILDYRKIDKRGTKFKNIHSLNWMVLNKEFQLLKCKLQHCEKLSTSTTTNIHIGGDNFIEITEDGMNELFRLGSTHSKSKQEQEDAQLLSNERMLLSELLLLILNNKKLEIANMNLPLMAISNNNLTALHILTNEPYSYQVYPSDLEWAIKHSSPLIVSEIIKTSPSSNIIISTDTRNNSIKLAFYNGCYRDEMLQLILDNPNLYNSPESLSTTTQITKKNNKKFKSENGTPIEIDTTSTETSTTTSNNNKLGIESILLIDSNEIQNRLLHLNYFSNRIMNKKISIKGKLEIIRTGIDNGSSGIDRVKEIYSIFSLESNEYYKSYLSRYDEPINGQDIMVLIKHCLSTFSIKSLSHLLSNELCIGYLNENKMKIYKVQIENQKSRPCSEFIKLYLSNTEIFSNLQCNESVDSSILKIKSSEKYELLLNEISTNCRYPSKWNSILSNYPKTGKPGMKPISDKETIDYLIEFKSNQFIEAIIKDLDAGIIKFKSVELIEYTVKSFNDNSITHSNRMLFKFAIENCDIETLSRIEKDRNWSKADLPPLDLIASQSIENLNRLFNYFKSINYDCFTKDSFFRLIDSIAGGKSLDEINQLSISSCPFNKFQKSSIRKFIKSITKYDRVPNKIQLILNNFNPISKLFIDFKACQQNSKLNLIYCIDRSISFVVPCYINIIVQTIEIILNHYTIEVNSSTLKYGTPINIEMYSNIINHLFKYLISCSGVKLDEILKVINLVNTTNENIKINCNGAMVNTITVSTSEDGRKVKQKSKQNELKITIDHSFYHSFYYICIKSVMLQKYIMSLPYILDIVEDEFYEIDMDNESMFFNIFNHINPSIFTFQYLFGTNGNDGASFDDILDKLINHLSLLPATNYINFDIYQEYYNETLNSNLLYLLEINRTDLFFKLLDQIQQQLNDTTIEIGNFPTELIGNKVVGSYVYRNGGENYEIYQQTITNGRVFKYSVNLFKFACSVFENSEYKFQKFISFCGYYSILGCIDNVDNIIINDHYFNHFNQYYQILDSWGKDNNVFNGSNIKFRSNGIDIDGLKIKFK